MKRTIKSLGLQQLLQQARFVPVARRVEQVEGCERLVRIIDPGREYPFDFICYHITGYRRPLAEPPAAPGATTEPGGQNWEPCDEVLDYGTLIRDLPLYAEQLSRTLKLRADDIAQKVYTVESLARHLGVCGKTVRRWRQEGLVGRYMCFNDDRPKLGFLENVVNHFMALHQERVEQGAAFSRSDEQERAALLRRLARWALRCPGNRQQAIERTARRFGRATEMVRLLLCEHEDNLAVFLPAALRAQLRDAGRSVGFDKRAETLSLDDQVAMTDLFEQGHSIKALCTRFGRSRANVYHAIALERARRLSEMAIEYVFADVFTRTGMKAEILGEHEEQMLAREKQKDAQPESAPPTKPLGSLEAYVADIGAEPVLSAEDEQFLFRKYNYLKHRAAQLQDEIDLKYPRARVMNQMRRFLAAAARVQERLIRSNLRLVLSVARRHTRDATEMMDLISEGNLVLMRAVDKFDFARGFKFSTYATWAIVRRFATLRSQRGRQVAVGVGGEEDILDIADGQQKRDTGKVEAVESLRRDLEQAMSQTLEEREAMVLRSYYALDGTNSKGQSFRQIGEFLGLSKERIRQIQQVALKKLHEVLAGQPPELLQA